MQRQRVGGQLESLFGEFGTAAENMTLPLSWEQGCDSGLMSQGGHLPPSTRPGEARNAGQQLEERRQAHEGERDGV